MSWDVFLIATPAGAKSLSDLSSDFDPPWFERAVAIERIVSLFPQGTNFSDPSWGVIDGDGWSMEVNIGKEPTTQSLMLHIRGGGDPITAALAISTSLGLTAFDCSSGDILTVEENCFDQWRAFRDQAFSER